MALYISKYFITVEWTSGEEEMILLGKNSKGSILPKTFQGEDNIKRVEVSKGIEYICADAFANCSNLEEIIIPASLKEINAYAFRGCDKLSSIVVNENITEVEYWANAFNITEVKPFKNLLDNLKKGWRVQFFVERSPCDDNWR
jgi:hypothetical protein